MKKRPEDWLGEWESDRLEFKREDVDDDKVLAVVVAFLNTKGGILVIGVDAPPGQPASAVTGVREPYSLAARLRDTILGRIDPPPYRLFKVHVVGAPPSSAVVVSVRESDTLHALRRGASLTFYVREADANHALGVREVEARLKDKPDESDRKGAAMGAFLAAENSLPNLGEQRAIDLTVHGIPAHTDPDDQGWKELRDEVRDLLSTEAPLDLRPDGWTFALWPHARPEVVAKRVRLGRASPLLRFVEIRRDGLVWGATRFAPEDPGAELRKDSSVGEYLAILDLAVAEYTTSIVRLASHAWQRARVRGDVYFCVVLRGRIGLEIATIGSTAGRRYRAPDRPIELPVGTGPVNVPAGDLYDAPDAVARRLLVRVFEEAGAEGLERYWVGDRFVAAT